MKRERLFLLAVMIISIIILSSCDTGGGGGFSSTLINVNVQYVDIPIGAFATKFFRFTAAGDGSHTIWLTDLTSDMSWVLFTNPSITNPNIIWSCDDWSDNSDEIDTTPVLTGGITYYIAVDEWDTIAGDFDLLVSFP